MSITHHFSDHDEFWSKMSEYGEHVKNAEVVSHKTEGKDDPGGEEASATRGGGSKAQHQPHDECGDC